MPDDHPTTDAETEDEYGKVSTGGADGTTKPEPVPADEDTEPAKQGD